MSRRGRGEQAKMAVLVTLLLYMAFVFGRGVWSSSDVVPNQPAMQHSTGSVAPPDRAESVKEVSESVCEVLRLDTSREGLRRAFVGIRDRLDITSQEVANLVSNAVDESCPDLEQAIFDAGQ